MIKHIHPNRLINEKSPYLLQHAYNPVDWYPWGDEAFDKAKVEDKPIFLSVGYSTCYWCHVMEREVFENDSIAKLMNEQLVCVKVDREERPDVDRVYMNALQAMSGSGGWPMSMFLTPDRKPFFGATYIPPQSQYGRPGFPELLQRIAELWKTDRSELLKSSDQIVDYLKSSASESGSGKISGATLDSAYAVFEANFDRLHAGFGSAPKFPRPVALGFLLRYYFRSRNDTALDMTLETLRAMALGGMYDQLGGGFHRYSVDAEWRVPHFEKMLYDQAQLAQAYTEAFQISHDMFFKDVAQDILLYVHDNLTDTAGGFYSAQDAESAPDASEPDHKEEGAFYTWSKSQIDQLLDQQQSKIFCFRYGVQEAGNAPHDPTNVFKGKNILFQQHSVEKTAARFSLAIASTEEKLRDAKAKLSDARARRPHPHLDDKILTGWNGLMISAYAKAYEVFNNPLYLSTAEKAARFIIEHLYDGDALMRRYRSGESRFRASLQDYTFLISGLLDLYEASFDIKWLNLAVGLTSKQVELFWDQAHGGFFDADAQDTSILVRTKENYDGAEPSGNSVAALNLLRLGLLTNNEKWRDMGQRTIQVFGGRVSQYPESMPAMLSAEEFIVSTPKEIVLVGNRNDNMTNTFIHEVYNRFLPNKILIFKDEAVSLPSLLKYLPMLQDMKMIDGKTTAFVCENYACTLPTNDPKIFINLLEGEKKNPIF